MPFFADLLRRADRHGLLIVPAIDAVDQLQYHAGLARQGITIFGESSATDVIAKAGSIGGPAGVNAFRLGSLRCEDGWRYVSSRMSGLRDEGDRAGIKIQRDTVDRVVAARIGGRGSMSIREPEFACQNVYEQVAQRGDAEMLLSDFHGYYLRRGVPRPRELR